MTPEGRALAASCRLNSPCPFLVIPTTKQSRFEAHLLHPAARIRSRQAWLGASERLVALRWSVNYRVALRRGEAAWDGNFVCCHAASGCFWTTRRGSVVASCREGKPVRLVFFHYLGSGGGGS